MKTEPEYDRVVNIGKQAWDFMSSYNIPPYPKCYDVWYQYIANENPDIVKAITDFLNKNGTPDYAFTEKLHATLLTYDSVARSVDMVTDLLNRELTGMNDGFADTQSELHAFNTLLREVGEKCKSGMSQEQVQSVTDNLQGASQKVSEVIGALKAGLEASHNEVRKLQNYLETVKQESNVDILTGLMSRRRFDQVMSQLVRDTVETDEPLSVLALEVDHYGAFKEKWGQITAEQILCFTSVTIKENIKGRDSAARYGNELFLLGLPKTERAGAKALGDHIRNAVERKRVVKKTTGEFLGRITVSGGVAQFKKGESIGVLMNRVNRTLEAARISGYNTIITDTDADKILASDKNNSGEKAA